MIKADLLEVYHRQLNVPDCDIRVANLSIWRVKFPSVHIGSSYLAEIWHKYADIRLLYVA